jgi:hypothetical protein
MPKLTSNQIRRSSGSYTGGEQHGGMKTLNLIDIGKGITKPQNLIERETENIEDH